MQHGWTLDRKKWNHLLTIVSGTRWSKTWLDQLYRDNIPESPGVYAICAKFKTSDYSQSLFKALL